MSEHAASGESDFLGRLSELLARSQQSYQGYMERGKTFLYASRLKDSNDAIRHLILENAHLLPQEQQRNAQKLLHHLDAWSRHWEACHLRLQPELTDTFVFDSEVRFPGAEVAALMDYHHRRVRR
ncbi:MAG: hypothetical protein Q8K31_08865 [Burkholderiaceae bacterium]|nr:hypothetical protein [Burkholderiaceae bacterium]MDP1969281.1 hypothetical protein [Burkholderiaceae bacterium]